MRYQYLSLVHLLEKGRYPDPGLPIKGHGDRWRPNVCQESDYGNEANGYFQDDANLSGWPRFMIQTSQFFNRKERCDCHRGTAETTVENRYYKGADGAAVSYFTKLFLDIHGHWPSPTDSIPPNLITPELYEEMGNKPLSWNVSDASFMNDILPQVEEMQGNVSAVLWNQGIWSERSDESFVEFADKTRDFFQARGARMFWKTTTRMGVASMQEISKAAERAEKESNFSRKLGWEVLDAYGITRELTIVSDGLEMNTWTDLVSRGPQPTLRAKHDLEVMAVKWDAFHFRPYVYEELNNVWLNQLCG